jgi:hypothetical protein
VADRHPGTDADVDRRTPEPTAEVGSEGGTPGDVEVAVDRVAGTGSEADETWRPVDEEINKVVRDETGKGRRSP